MLLAALALTACEYDDSALWEQVNQNTERIAALEAWQVETNTNIQSLQTLLNTTDHITAVTPVMENEVEVGYTISFLNSDPITIYKGDNGTPGSTPEIGVTQDKDGNWYWTLNGDQLLGDNDEPIQANGDSAPVPQLKTGDSLTNVTKDTAGDAIKPEAIYLSVDGGEKWTRVSGTDGDSFFSKVDTSDPTCVTFTLADGTTFSVPRYTGIKLNFDMEAVHLGYGGTQPVNFTAEGSDQFTTDNLFIIAPDGWKAEVTLPTRAATEFILTVIAPADETSGAAEGEILMMLDNQQGNTTIGRIKVDCKSTNLVMNNVTAGALATAIGNRANLTSITVTSGTLNEADWAAVRKNSPALLYLDLEGATYEVTDKDVFYSGNSAVPLLTVQLPQGITALGEYAFSKCTALKSITLPDGLESIGKYAFMSCSSLTSIDLPDGVTTIGYSAFSNCSALTSIDLPDGLKSIEGYTFYNCTALKSITLPKELTTIGGDAFRSCTSLTSIDLPEGLTSIGKYAFNTCSALTSIDLPDGLKSIEMYTFSNCTSLTSITLPDGLESIGDYALQSCFSLTSIDLPDGLKSFGNYAFINCEALTSIDLPDGVTTTGNGTFANCNSLKSITLPDGVTTIGYSAFYNCPALTSIDLPEGVTTIGNQAFYNCSALTSIDLPEGLTRILDYAFQSCTSLTTVTCQATGVPNLGVDAFKDCSRLANIYVPAGSVDGYKAATGWSDYKNIIQAIP